MPCLDFLAPGPSDHPGGCARARTKVEPVVPSMQAELRLRLEPWLVSIDARRYDRAL